mgnify:CR=1 FL=1
MRRRGRDAETGHPSPGSGAPGPAPVALTLADLAPGQSADVVAVRPDQTPRTAQRLVDLGFAPGNRVEVVRQAPLRTPILYRVQGYEVSLRRTEAARIDVTAPSPR